MRSQAVAVPLFLLLWFAAPPAAPPPTVANPWSAGTRDVLSQYCGSCHRSDLKTAVPRALAVFDLLDDRWDQRLTKEQLDGLLMRVRGTRSIPAVDAETVTKFVRCARDGECATTEGGS